MKLKDAFWTVYILSILKKYYRTSSRKPSPATNEITIL